MVTSSSWDFILFFSVFSMFLCFFLSRTVCTLIFSVFYFFFLFNSVVSYIEKNRDSTVAMRSQFPVLGQGSNSTLLCPLLNVCLWCFLAVSFVLFNDERYFCGHFVLQLVI